MNKIDFSNIKYLQINAKDDYELALLDIIIDITTDCLVSGKIIIYEDENNPIVIDVQYNLNELKQNSLFAKFVDTGTYKLLDKDMNALYEINEFYVPTLLDYYNITNGYGDYVDLYIEDKTTGKLKHRNNDIFSYIGEDKWIAVNNEIVK